MGLKDTEVLERIQIDPRGKQLEMLRQLYDVKQPTAEKQENVQDRRERELQMERILKPQEILCI